MKEYITPTKQRPVFTASCNHFGSIERSLYKDWNINNSVGRTFSLSYSNAVNDLHEWIKDNQWVIKEYPKCKLEIEVIDGTINKYNEPKRIVVYSISASKAKRFLF